MKTELATAIGSAIIGILIAFFITNIFIGEIEEVTIKTVDSTVSTDLADPNPEVFNYRALNPTVEVYVGDCAEYNANGECIEQVTEEDIINLEVPTESEEDSSTTKSTDSSTKSTNSSTKSTNSTDKSSMEASTISPSSNTREDK